MSEKESKYRVCFVRLKECQIERPLDLLVYTALAFSKYGMSRLDLAEWLDVPVRTMSDSLARLNKLQLVQNDSGLWQPAAPPPKWFATRKQRKSGWQYGIQFFKVLRSNGSLSLTEEVVLSRIHDLRTARFGSATSEWSVSGIAAGCAVHPKTVLRTVKKLQERQVLSCTLHKGTKGRRKKAVLTDVGVHLLPEYFGPSQEKAKGNPSKPGAAAQTGQAKRELKEEPSKQPNGAAARPVDADIYNCKSEQQNRHSGIPSREKDGVLVNVQTEAELLRDFPKHFNLLGEQGFAYKDCLSAMRLACGLFDLPCLEGLVALAKEKNNPVGYLIGTLKKETVNDEQLGVLRRKERWLDGLDGWAAELHTGYLKPSDLLERFTPKGRLRVLAKREEVAEHERHDAMLFGGNIFIDCLIKGSTSYGSDEGDEWNGDASKQKYKYADRSRLVCWLVDKSLKERAARDVPSEAPRPVQVVQKQPPLVPLADLIEQNKKRWELLVAQLKLPEKEVEQILRAVTVYGDPCFKRLIEYAEKMHSDAPSANCGGTLLKVLEKNSLTDGQSAELKHLLEKYDTEPAVQQINDDLAPFEALRLLRQRDKLEALVPWGAEVYFAEAIDKAKAEYDQTACMDYYDLASRLLNERIMEFTDW